MTARDEEGATPGSGPYDVIVWGTGMVGQYALRYLFSNSNMRLVAAKCYTEKKEGVDASTLSGVDRPASGVLATQDADAVIATDADCVIFAPFDPLTDPTVPGSPSSAWVPDLLNLLRSGKNVMTTVMPITHWRHLNNGDAFREEVLAACREGDSTLFVTGLDPGFVPDAAAYAMSSIVGEITQINTWETLNYGTYPIIPTLQSLGFGASPEAMAGADGTEPLRICWGGAPHLLADSFGITLDDVRVDADISLAPETFTADCGLAIEKGTIDALSFKVIGSVDGRDLFVVNHVSRMGPDAAPHWRRIGHDGGYAIELDAFPPLRGEFPMGLEGGTGASWSDAMVMTSARCINAVESVVQAAPGWPTFLELPSFGARHALHLK